MHRNDAGVRPAPAIRWTTLAVIALVLCALSTFELRMSYGRRLPTVSVLRAAAMAAPRWLTLIPCAPLFGWAMRRFPLDQWQRWRTMAAHGALAAVLAVIQAAVYTTFFRYFAPWPMPNGALDNFVHNFAWAVPSAVLSYATIVGGTYAVEQARGRREREVQAATLAAQLSDARLEALRAQLNPHFLFNTLNSLAALVSDRSTERALRAIEHLGDLLRYVLDEGTRREVPLHEEMEFAARYLAIEQVRFSDRLRTEIVIADEVREALVPSLILQPIVENAVRHGIAVRSSEGRVALRASRSGDRLVLRVEDDGPGPNASVDTASGVGLANTRARLRELYGNDAGFVLAHREGMTVAELTLPLRVVATGAA